MRLNLTIFQKGLLLVAVPLLFQLGFIGLVALAEQESAAADQWFVHTKEVLGQMQVVIARMMEAETGSRGYLLTGDPVFAEPFERARRETPAAFQQLRTLVSDNPEQEQRVQQLMASADQLIAWHAENIRLVRAGARAEAVTRVQTLEGKHRMDHLRQGIEPFVAEEQRLDSERMQAAQRSRRWLRWILLAGTVASLSSTVLLGVVFSRGINRRLAILADNAQRLAQGKVLAPPLPGTDEISHVDQVFRDMSQELVRSQQSLRQQTALLQSILDNIGEGVVVADEQGAFQLFNPAAQHIVGLGATAARPDNWSATYGAYLPDRVTPFPTDEQPLMRAIRGEPSDQVEMFIRNPQVPEGVWIHLSGRPLRDDQGLARGGVVVFRNVTRLKQSEAKILQLNAELEQRVQERTRELTDANRELAQKNQENELFVYSVSHDLRSPLVNLEGFSKELAMVGQEVRGILMDPALPTPAREHGLALVDGDMTESIRFIQVAVRRLSAIIDALLRLSRVGRVEFQWQAVDVGPLVGRIVASLATTIREREATVVVKELFPVWENPTAVEQVFANLIGNAVNYLDKQRPGRIEVGSLDSAINGHSHSPEGHTYYVKDNGLGIPAAHQAKVFQAFQRVHPGVAKGEGMGLTVVHRIVERHGGKIWFESAEGAGTTFFLTLPAPHAPALGTHPAGGTKQFRLPKPEECHAHGIANHPVGRG